MDELEKPENVSMEVNVVEHLNVVWLRASSEKQLRQRTALLVRRPMFFPFSNDAHERRVTASARHGIGFRTWAVIQQQARDGAGLVRNCRAPQSREAHRPTRAPS